jgi:malonyl-CoA decarboxylase
VKQSFGLMVNYLYDLRKIDSHRKMLAAGKIPVSGDVESLYF